MPADSSVRPENIGVCASRFILAAMLAILSKPTASHLIAVRNVRFEDPLANLIAREY